MWVEVAHSRGEGTLTFHGVLRLSPKLYWFTDTCQAFKTLDESDLAEFREIHGRDIPIGGSESVAHVIKDVHVSNYDVG